MLSLPGIVIGILFGALAGWITAKLMKVQSGFWLNVILGILGSIIGNLILRLLSNSTANNFLSSLIVAVLGGCLLTAIVRYFTRKARA